MFIDFFNRDTREEENELFKTMQDALNYIDTLLNRGAINFDCQVKEAGYVVLSITCREGKLTTEIPVYKK